MRRTALLAALTALAFPAAAHAQGRTVTRNSQTIDIMCRADGRLSVIGNNNHITTDRCTRVTVAGNGNTLTLYLRPNARLRLTGNDNQIRWVRAQPRVENVGARNTVSEDQPGRD